MHHPFYIVHAKPIIDQHHQQQQQQKSMPNTNYTHSKNASIDIQNNGQNQGDGSNDPAKVQDDAHRNDGTNGGDTTLSRAADTTTSSSTRSKRGADKHYLSGTSPN